jgi:hypothetical protein
MGCRIRIFGSSAFDQAMLQGGGPGSIYIVGWGAREPLDQTDLSRAKMHPWRRWKEVAEDDRWGPQQQAGRHQGVGPVGTPQKVLVLPFAPVSSGVFLILLA